MAKDINTAHVLITMSDEAVREAVVQAAKLMALSAKTAPKARGVDNLVIKIITDEKEKEELAKMMIELAPIYGDFFERDADNVLRSDAVLLIGCKIVDLRLKGPEDLPIDANAFCSIANLGIAVGSAVKTASMLNVDNRVMYSVGIAAQKLKIIDADLALGIPLSAKQKNIYFDRKWR